jgi:hypothetical protein
MCADLLNIGILSRRSEGKKGPRRYRPHVPPALFSALGQGFRAVARAPWLVAVGALVAWLRRAAVWPAWVVLVALLARAAAAALAEHPFDPAAPVEAILAALASTRLAALVLGLWLAGVLLGAALRVAWLAGALPTLGGALAGEPRAPRFAAGVAYLGPKVLAAAALGLVADLAGAGFAATLALAALRVTAVASPRAPLLLAAAAAFALSLAVLVPLALGALADAAVARAALRGEGPGAAFAGALRRFLLRPGAFVLAALIFAAAAGLAPLSVRTAGALALGFARDAGPALLVGPNLMVSAAALVLAAALDLWWLGTVAVLACGGPPRPSPASR